MFEGLVKIGLAIVGIASIGVIYTTVASTDFAKYKAECLRDDCDKLYGKATDESIHCMIAIFTKLQSERKAAEMDTIYQRAR